MKKIFPDELHKWYLEAVKHLDPKSYNIKAQKKYSSLTDEQRFIDQFIAEKINEKLNER